MAQSLDLTFEDSADGAVLIFRADDHNLVRTVHPGESGFVRVVMRGMARERQLAGVDVAIVRTGSRGLFWLEPMVEVQTPAGRVAYGPVAPQDVQCISSTPGMRILTG